MQEAEVFAKALQFVLRWEGGYIHHPSDPGGATNQGITQAVYDSWRRQQGLPARTVANISGAEVEAIYRSIWQTSRAGQLAEVWPRTAVVVFDLTVQSGLRGGVQLMQRALGELAIDGIWGPLTQRRLEFWLNKTGDVGTAVRLASERVIFRGERVFQNRSQLSFLQGWLRRDADLLRLVVSW